MKGHSVFPCLLVVALGWLFGHVRSAGASPASWLKIEADEFVVYSDAPPKQVIECALRYAAFRRVFSEMFVPRGSSLPPSVLLIFRTAKSFKAMTRPANSRYSEIHNYFAEVDGTPFKAFALDGDRDSALDETFQFETIWALQRVNDSIPIWMAQGAGEVLATVSISEGKCVVGEKGDYPFSEMFPWPGFFKTNKDKWVFENARELGYLQGQAWGLLHWVLLNDSATGEHFKTLALRLRNSAALDAIAAEMNTDADDLSKAISHHLSHNRVRTIPFDETSARARLLPVPAPDVEVFVQETNLLRANSLFAQSDALLEKARAMAPDLPMVKEAQARRLCHNGEVEEAIRLYREAIAGGSKDVMAYLLSASARLDDLRTGDRDVAGGGGMASRRSVEELRQAIKLSPGDGEAFRLLGRAFFVQPKITDAEVAELSPGIVAGESGGAVRYYRALLYSRLGRMGESYADLRGIISDPLLPDELRGTAKRALSSEILKADARRIQTFLQEKNYSAARATVRAAEAGPDDESVLRAYQRLNSIIDEQEAAGAAH